MTEEDKGEIQQTEEGWRVILAPLVFESEELAREWLYLAPYAQKSARLGAHLLDELAPHIDSVCPDCQEAIRYWQSESAEEEQLALPLEEESNDGTR